MGYFWKKKEIVSYILSIFVFLIHISSFSNYSHTGNTISVINEHVKILFKYPLPMIAVPLFFILSGMLFFRNYNNTMYFDKLKARLKTLFIPFVIWNIIWMFFEIITSYSFISSYFIGREKFIITLANILDAIFHYGCNGPFWFIFELMFFVIITPLINIIIKNKYIGFITILALCILLRYNIGLPSPLFYSPEAIIYYLLGGIIGKHYFEKFSKKSSLKHRAIATLCFILCFVLRYICTLFEYKLDPTIHISFIIIYALSFWIGIDWFIDKLKLHNFYSYSFVVYATHINLSAIISKLLFLILPKTEYFAIPNFLLTFVITLIIINITCSALKRFVPKIYSMLTGSR